MRRLLTLIIALLPVLPVFAQRNISADIEMKEVSGGKLTITRKHVCCSSDGRLVSFVSYPREFYTLENNGEGYIYIPSTNQYYRDLNGNISSKDNILDIFMSRSVFDMGLGRYGYTLKSSHTDEDGNLIRRFVTTKPDDTPIINIVFSGYLPICIIYLNSDESIRGRTYLSDYRPCGRMSIPCRTTEIIYTHAKDSVVSRTVYSNIKIDSDDPLMSFEIPSDAKPVSLK